MSTHHQETLAKEKLRAKTAPRFVFKAAGFDIFDRRAHTPEDGTIVIKTQPGYGCPKNGTMGQCYIADLDGEFIGMVSLASLTKAGRTL